MISGLFLVPESSSEEYFHISERQKRGKSCPKPQKKNYTCLIIHAAAAELHASQGQTATHLWILFFIPSVLLFLSPLLFYSHVASCWFPLTLNRWWTDSAVPPTLFWPEAKCFWGCPDFHLFIVIMNTTETHWWKCRLIVLEPKGSSFLKFGQVSNRCF